MYERNAIVLERYFNQMFGYNMKNNIKTNFKDYCELVESFEKYKDITDEEDNIMQEYDQIANRIREIQKRQEVLSKRNTKYQSEREDIFQNIDENSEAIERKFDLICSNIQSIDEQIKENAKDFINVVAEFNEKSVVRTTCGRARRNIENTAKQFIDMPTEEIDEELKEKIKKNGEKEKIPFNMDVITKAISLSVDVQKRETEILANVYDKTNKLFTEIKNNSTKGDKHKKLIKDSKSKLEFVGALKEYLVQFLDNERLTAVNGAEEHTKLMEEACKNLDEDLIQINNLYTLLLKEITKKITKKSYAELYNIDYLTNLERKSEEFERQIKKLNLPVTIINPNYWRIEGMKKIYDIFYKTVTEEYGRDLSEYMPKEDPIDEYEEDDDWDFEDEEKEEIKPKKIKRKIKGISKEEPTSEERDEEIDMLLGFNDDKKDDKEEKWDDDDFDDDFGDKEDDDVYYDIWGNDINDEDGNDRFDDDDDFDDDEDLAADDDDDWDDEDEDNLDDADYIFDRDDDDDFEDNEEESEDEDEFDDEEDDENLEEDEDDWEDDDWDDEDDFEDDEEEVKKSENKKAKSKKKTEDDDWGNEFVKIEKKSTNKKKKGFFEKFKK